MSLSTVKSSSTNEDDDDAESGDDNWLNLYMDSDDDDDDDNYAEAFAEDAPPSSAVKPLAKQPIASKKPRPSKSKPTAKRLEYARICARLTHLIRNQRYNDVMHFLDENGTKLTSVGRFLRSLMASAPSYYDEELAIRVIKRFIDMPCHQKGHAISASLFQLSTYYASTDLPRLLIDRLLRFNVPNVRVEQLAKTANITLHHQHIPFLVDWIQRTKYTLPFTFSILYCTGASKGDLTYVLREAARTNRLVCGKVPASTMLRDYLSNWSATDLVLFARYATKEEHAQLERWITPTPPRMLHDRSIYIDCIVANPMWQRIQYCCYLNYALALGHLDGVGVYVIVWIVEWLIAPNAAIIPHIKGVRLAEKVLAAHKRRRERIAASPDAKQLK